MRKIGFIIVSVTILVSCKYDSIEVTNSELPGKWLLTELLADPGDGSGMWQKVPIEKQQYITFGIDYTFTSDPDLLEHYQSYKISSSSSLTLLGSNPSDSLRMEYSLSDQLQLSPPCIEGCGLRLVKVKDF